jgi:glycosyltransferase involved in cell wall biosynthesis
MQIDLGVGWAGGQSQSFALAQGLAKRGHEVIFVCRKDGELARRLADGPITLHEITVRGRLDITAIIRLARLIKKVNADLVHAHESLSFWLAGIAIKLTKPGLPFIVHKRTDHLPGPLGRFRYNNIADHSIAISRGVEASLLQAAADPEKIALIYSSVDCEKFHPDAGALAKGFRKEQGFSDDSLLVGAVGSLVSRKGHQILLNSAFAILQELPETRFIICGAGPLEATLKKQAVDLGIETSVRFLSERADVRPLLAGLTVFVMPSLAEGLGVAALEAMAMAKPVVASRVGGLAEVVEDGGAGFLVKPGDSQELAEAVLRLLKDSRLRETMGRAARQRAENLFSREQMITRTEGVYFSCIKPEAKS